MKSQIQTELSAICGSPVPIIYSNSLFSGRIFSERPLKGAIPLDFQNILNNLKKRGLEQQPLASDFVAIIIALKNPQYQINILQKGIIGSLYKKVNIEGEAHHNNNA